jgi:hypothetical protein
VCIVARVQLNAPPLVLLLASSRLGLQLALCLLTNQLLMLAFAPLLLLALPLGHFGSLLPIESRFMLLFRAALRCSPLGLGGAVTPHPNAGALSFPFVLDYHS